MCSVKKHAGKQTGSSRPGRGRGLGLQASLTAAFTAAAYTYVHAWQAYPLETHADKQKGISRPGRSLWWGEPEGRGVGVKAG